MSQRPCFCPVVGCPRHRRGCARPHVLRRHLEEGHLWSKALILNSPWAPLPPGSWTRNFWFCPRDTCSMHDEGATSLGSLAHHLICDHKYPLGYVLYAHSAFKWSAHATNVGRVVLPEPEHSNSPTKSPLHPPIYCPVHTCPYSQSGLRAESHLDPHLQTHTAEEIGSARSQFMTSQLSPAKMTKTATSATREYSMASKFEPPTSKSHEKSASPRKQVDLEIPANGGGIVSIMSSPVRQNRINSVTAERTTSTASLSEASGSPSASNSSSTPVPCPRPNLLVQYRPGTFPTPQPSDPPTVSGHARLPNPLAPQQLGASRGPSETVAEWEQRVVIEYLVKKGYNKTEQTLRQESAHLDKDGRPIQQQSEELGNIKYSRGFRLLSNWIDQNLDIYKSELNRLTWPIFVYSYLDLIVHDATKDAEKFFEEFSERFLKIHSDEINTLRTIKIPAHVFENPVSSLYWTKKYRIPLNKHVYFNLITFLESNSNAGGLTIVYLLQSHCDVRETERGPIDQFSFEAIINQGRGVEGDPSDLQEGIPGAFTGVSNKDIMSNTSKLKLGMVAMEPDLAGDVLAELEDEDQRNPPEPGQNSLVEEFKQHIKREDTPEGPARGETPLPPSRARDVVMEVQKIKENRDRFRIEPLATRSGMDPGVSVCMFTMHNTLDAVTCIEFSDDTNLVAVGTEESYIRVWNLHGEPLPSIVASAHNEPPTSSRRLIGHTATVYSVSFSPSILGPDNPDANTPSTAPRLLVSCSSDKTVRLWSLETWTCLVVYKAHEGPVWNVKWGPFGHYFATCGWDRTVRVWMQDHISPVRLMVGHDTSVNQVAWHPNGAYVFSASDQADKTVRMWLVTTGECVRVFPGHTEMISALECSPSGKILASADNGGTIILWDLESGQQIKRCRGHGKGGIWSLSFSVESTVLCSGGADGTVRVWDVAVAKDPHKGDDGEIIAAGGQADATRINAAGAPATAAAGMGGKKKGKDTTITPDQISAFPTKKTPVYKVKFTRMNLVMAGGCYLP